jgi:antitoxin HicB
MKNPTSLYRIPLILTPQPEGGYTVTSSTIPELVTEGDTIQEALAHVQDALQAAIELYADLGKTLPADIQSQPLREPINFEYLLPGV